MNAFSTVSAAASHHWVWTAVVAAAATETCVTLPGHESTDRWSASRPIFDIPLMSALLVPAWMTWWRHWDLKVDTTRLYQSASQSLSLTFATDRTAFFPVKNEWRPYSHLLPVNRSTSCFISYWFDMTVPDNEKTPIYLSVIFLLFWYQTNHTFLLNCCNCFLDQLTHLCSKIAAKTWKIQESKSSPKKPKRNNWPSKPRTRHLCAYCNTRKWKRSTMMPTALPSELWASCAKKVFDWLQCFSTSGNPFALVPILLLCTYS